MHIKRQVAWADAFSAKEIEGFIRHYSGKDLLHDIDVHFPRASYLAFLIAARRVYGDLDGRLVGEGEQQ
jgi:hypothetical protein